jgi:hypothetical protein
MPDQKSNCFSHTYKFILFLIFFGTLHQASAQKFILLQKGSNQKTRIKYEIGEELIYKTKDFDFFLYDEIVDISNEIIVLKENVLTPKEILVVDIRSKDPRNQTLKNLSMLGIGGGILFLAAQGVNSLIQEGDLRQIDTWGVPLGMIGTGVVLSKIRYRNFNHQGRNKIQTVVLYGD